MIHFSDFPGKDTTCKVSRQKEEAQVKFSAYAFLKKKEIGSDPPSKLKGILHQKFFYRLNLIFWIVMGCGIARLITRDLEGQREMINHWSVLSVLLPLETPWCCASKPLGTNFETKIFKFWWFLGPSDQNELYHTPLISKIWDLGDKNFLVEDPFKKTSSPWLIFGV